MRTSLKARLFRLSGISVAVAALLMACVAAVTAEMLSSGSGQKQGSNAVNVCASIINDELGYISECLDTAVPSMDGDLTFEKIFMNGDDSGYDYSSVSDITTGLETGEFTITTPVKNDNGEMVVLAAKKRADGIIFGEIGYDYFDSCLNTLRISENDIGFLCNDSGDIILSTDYAHLSDNLSLSEYYGLNSIVNDLSIQQGGTLTDSSDNLNGGMKIMYTYLPVPEYGYNVIYGTDSSNITKPFYNVLWVILGMLIFDISLTLIIANVVGNQVSKSIVPVTERLVKLADGDVHTPIIPNERGDESQLLGESMARTINELSEYITDIDTVLAGISNCNLTVESNVEYDGDFKEIKRSLNMITENLRTIIGDIQSASEQVHSGADMLASSAQQLAQNTAEEASTLEQINTMTADIEEHIDNTAENATKASTLLHGILENIRTGSATMSQMSTSMEEIKESSDEIQNIVSIIEDIAFQTNILALNAAVEAARAGEAGKGFAVVADEVRNLATKSSEAAKDTMDLVKKSVESVSRGNELTMVTDASLREITESIDHFSRLMDEINYASNEQAESIKQINIGISQITNAVQSNSATAEQCAASSEELKAQADILNEQVERFAI
ncbi:MAG: methyl-accepting chemotaxis protein [Oscillospiraceae bacterium]|nr:methyl-accepting chemotaxis protein [Oscillospiraceae bacterium]